MATTALEILTVSGVRGYEKDGTVYLNIEDTARGLGFVMVRNERVTTSGDAYTAVRWNRVNEYLKEFGYPHEVGKDDYIPENIFYRLAMKAKNEVAEKFQAKVADEILPTIRKHGVYMTTEALEKAILNPDFMLKVVTELKKEKDARIAAEQTIQDMTPHYELGKKVGDTKAAISVKEFSEVLCKNGYKIGQNNLFRWFVDRGYLYKRGRKYLICQDYLDQKLFDVIEQIFNLPGTEVEQVNVKIMITGKGQDYFLNKFEEEKNLASIQGE